jgi:hypothetical protein
MSCFPEPAHTDAGAEPECGGLAQPCCGSAGTCDDGLHCQQSGGGYICGP